MLYVQNVQGGCSRIPLGANGERSPVDDNFKILIDGNPETYIPDHPYNVSLSCPSNMKFVGFTLVVESEDQSAAYNGQDVTGHFELFSNSDTKFSVGCENMIEATNTNAKTRIDVSWVAPKQPDSGCVLIKAAVAQHRDVWFIDDGFLTKRICAEEIDELNSQTPSLQNCCACDEAKYEIVLERKWTRNTHAKDFPPEAWRTRIGEIIGASHSYSYRYWAYGQRASLGVQELAEHGATRTLEQEIRENTQNGEVRTIIKAPGIGYRKNVYGTTLANARVDPKHHQISLAAKVDPSPDWILGVAGLELCLSNCTWLERKVLNLYPWDTGTDSGPSYMSADSPQVPPDVIRRISSTYPSDYRSPFFDDTGAPMKPLATLYVTRKKLYVRECEEVPQEGPLECATHPWNEWSNCSMRCGPGYSQRIRSFKNPMLAASYNCDRHLEETRECQGTQCRTEELDNGELDSSNNYSNLNSPESMAKCELTAWSDWSSCSKTCGRGYMNRTRDYYNRQAKNHCQTVMRLPLEETQQCIGSDCGGTIPDNGELDGLPEPDAFGDINTSNNYNPGSSWSKANSQNRLESDRINQGWNNNNLSPSSPVETQRGYDSNWRQPVELENPNYKDYRQDNRANLNYNENEQEMNSNNYDYINKPQLKPGFNYDDNNKPHLNSGFSTRPPFIPYPERENAADKNYNVVQDYCYEKPYASTLPCLANPVVVKNYWYYDHDAKECRIFTTDNCDQNRNRFRTLMACEGTCLQPQINQARTEDDTFGNVQSNGGEFTGGLGQPMSQTRGKYNNPRRGRYGK
ncbi:spondin-1 [Drosophila innubila]|uniref:spondin-1 n=1 Tax=Drosophila innubila TaxID=198719 RepID=UPI00148C2CCD|nr:spondin-1 [Drosophila innubila]